MENLGGLDEEVVQENKKESEKATEFKPKRRPFHYWEVGERSFKLKLTTAMIAKLENKYKTNIMNLISEDGIPALSVMLTVIQAAMVPWEHGVSYSDIMKLYDSWTEAGGNQMKFFTEVLLPTMAVSGFFTEKQAEAMKESMEGADELL